MSFWRCAAACPAPWKIWGGFQYLFLTNISIHYTNTESFPYPALFQVSFRIDRLRQPDAYLPSGALDSERNLSILKYYQARYIILQVSELFNLAYQRVHQIVGC